MFTPKRAHKQNSVCSFISPTAGLITQSAFIFTFCSIIEFQNDRKLFSAAYKKAILSLINQRAGLSNIVEHEKVRFGIKSPY